MRQATSTLAAAASLLLAVGSASADGKTSADSDAWLVVRPEPTKALRLQRPGGSTSVAATARIQLRYSGTLDADGDEHDWAVRRARLKLSGSLFGRHNKYKLELGFSPKDMALKDGRINKSPAMTWYMAFDYLRDFSVRVGQFKVPFNRQRIISSGAQQFVDRSLSNGEFNLDRDIGVQLYSKDLLGIDLLRYAVYVGLGDGRDNFAQDDAGLMYIGRLEVLPFGTFSDYSEADFSRSRRPRLSIGVAYGFVHRAAFNRGIKGSKPSDGGKTNTHNVALDMMFKWYGLSVQSELLWRRGYRLLDSSGAAAAAETEAPRDGIGAMFQAGYYLRRFEVAGRYSLVRGLGASSLGDKNELGAVLSHYFWKHPLKMQVDYFRMWGNSFAQGGHQVRVQVQLSI